ncbi:hypothetical protein RJ639_033904 [Escallonia herrerae]|uniref:Uncharacterized protein n=1 Tax=Escallonia herrerae TaxID=1293975 RepID=A0AA88WTS0_9ASTE|nr:hypothetical protein RJ639_033904 [Escallonia herrerae]
MLSPVGLFAFLKRIGLQHSGGTVYATSYVAPAHSSVGLGERPEKFNEKDFKRFLQEDAPDLGDYPDRQTVVAVNAWKHSDFLCKNCILNGLDNALYNVYRPMVNVKGLWESLERKYKTEEAGSKKLVVGKFIDFKMVDSKTVISQVQELQLILHDIHAEGMHKRKEMKLEDLIVRLRIEEDNRQSEKKAGNYHQEAKANVVEQGLTSRKDNNVQQECRQGPSIHLDNLQLQIFPLYTASYKMYKALGRAKKDYGGSELDTKSHLPPLGQSKLRELWSSESEGVDLWWVGDEALMESTQEELLPRNGDVRHRRWLLHSRGEHGRLGHRHGYGHVDVGGHFGSYHILPRHLAACNGKRRVKTEETEYSVP